jgi:hypothetical protein
MGGEICPGVAARWSPDAGRTPDRARSSGCLCRVSRRRPSARPCSSGPGVRLPRSDCRHRDRAVLAVPRMNAIVRAVAAGRPRPANSKRRGLGAARLLRLRAVAPAPAIAIAIAWPRLSASGSSLDGPIYAPPRLLFGLMSKRAGRCRADSCGRLGKDTRRRSRILWRRRRTDFLLRPPALHSGRKSPSAESALEVPS